MTDKKSPYRLTVETNYRLIKGEPIPRQEQEEICAMLLEGAQPLPADKNRRKRELYPVFYQPGEGVKVRSLFGQTPKTKILSGNMVELEILRLLCLLDPEDPQVALMRDETLRRLKTTCFGWQDDGVGECFDASLVTLRFLCAAAPNDTAWIMDRIENYNRHAGDKKRPWFPLWYFWLCLSEMPLELALPEIEKHRPELDRQLRRSCVMHSPQDKAVHPVLMCMLRNLMARLPGQERLAGCKTYISGKDGRVRLNLPEDFRENRALQTL